MTKRVYFWNILGNLSAAGISVLLLMIVSRLLPSLQADLFSLAYSIGHLWVVIGLFQVRNYQSTDVSFQYKFESYLTARLVSTLCMLFSIVPYLLLIDNGQSHIGTHFFIVLVVIYRMWDAIADVFQGFLQQHDRLDIAGKSMFIRYATSVCVWAIVLMMSQSLVIGISSLIVWNGIVVYFFDVLPTRRLTTIQWRQVGIKADWREVKSILAACFPLFLNGFLLVYIFNEPKLVIEQGLKEGWLKEGMQRDYNILFMPVFFMSLCILIIRPLITQLARLWTDKQIDAFKKVIVKIVGILLVGGVIATVLAYVMGIPVLSFLFGVDLLHDEVPLSVLVFSGVLYALAVFFENILTILRKQKHLVFIYLLMLGIAKWMLPSLIKQHGLVGASSGFLVVMCVYCIGSIVLAFFEVEKEKEK